MNFSKKSLYSGRLQDLLNVLLKFQSHLSIHEVTVLVGAKNSKNTSKFETLGLDISVFEVLFDHELLVRFL